MNTPQNEILPCLLWPSESSMRQWMRSCSSCWVGCPVRVGDCAAMPTNQARLLPRYPWTPSIAHCKENCSWGKLMCYTLLLKLKRKGELLYVTLKTKKKKWIAPFTFFLFCRFIESANQVISCIYQIYLVLFVNTPYWEGN